MKRLVSTLLLFAFLHFCCFSQQLFTWEQAYQQIDDIELNLKEALNSNKLLENKNKQLENQVSVLDAQVMNWETLYNLQMEESKAQLKEFKALEKQCSIWKTTTIVCGTGLLIFLATSMVLWMGSKK